MRLIHCSQVIKLSTPSTIRDAEASGVWLSSMSDSAWQALIDFRNWPNWLPGVAGVQLTDQESPARGTQLRLDGNRVCTIQRWDPPRSLDFTIDSKRSEMAYGFTVQTLSAEPRLEISLQIEREIGFFGRLFSPLLRWQLRKLAARTISNLATRLRPPQS